MFGSIMITQNESYNIILMTKLFDIESFAFLHSSEIEESSVCSYTKIYKKHKEINFESIVYSYTTYVKEMSNLHTQRFGVPLFFLLSIFNKNIKYTILY